MHARNGIQIHRSNLHPRDVTRKHGIPLTSPARTLLDLPQPAVNAPAGDWEADLLWCEHRLVVETGGYAFHSSRGAFERDRRKDPELQAAGYRVIRYTWRQITDEPEAVIATLAAALAYQR